MKSTRFKEILRTIDSGKVKVLSLDIFDTLVWRQVSHPTHVFYLTALKLRRKHTNLFSIDPVLFMQERIKAEEHARITFSNYNHEVTIQEVYDCLNIPLKIDNESLIQAELESEIELLKPNNVIYDLIEHCKKKQIKIVLCSDMYWPNKYLKQIVKQVFENNGKELFDFDLLVSCDYRNGKHNGGLYSELLKQCGDVKSEEVLHIGDNYESDVKQSTKNGIESFYFQRSSPLYTKLLEREKFYNRHHDFENNFGLDSLRLQAVFDHQKPSISNAQNLSYHNYGSFILGPIFTLFAEWLVDIALKRNQKVIYCLMRDGYLISRLINKICEARNLDIEAKEIWISRRIIKRASLFTADRLELNGLFENRCHPSLSFLTKDLGIELQVLQHLTGVSHEEPLKNSEVEHLLNVLENNSIVRKRIVEHSKEVRNNLVSYLANEGFFDTRSNIIVDLGWGGTIQKKLQKVLDWENLKVESLGLYLATHSGIKSLNDTCTEHKGFLTDQGEEVYACQSIIYMPEILEQACMDRRGTLKEITKNGEILTEDNLIPELQLDSLEKLQQGIFNFCDLWLQNNKYLEFTSHTRTVLRNYLLSILIPSIKQPLPQEAELFSNWGHDTNDGTDEVEPILGKFHVRNNALALTREQILSLTRFDCYWPEGLLALLDGQFGYHNYIVPIPETSYLSHEPTPVQVVHDPQLPVYVSPEVIQPQVIEDGSEYLLNYYIVKYENLPGWYKKGGHVLKFLTGKKKPFRSKKKFIKQIREKARESGAQARYNEVKLWYSREYEALPSWYKKFGTSISNN